MNTIQVPDHPEDWSTKTTGSHSKFYHRFHSSPYAGLIMNWHGNFDKGWEWWGAARQDLLCSSSPPPNWTRRTHPGPRLAPGLDGNIIWDLELHFTVFSNYWAKFGVFCQLPLLGHSLIFLRVGPKSDQWKQDCLSQAACPNLLLSCCLSHIGCLGHFGS